MKTFTIEVNDRLYKDIVEFCNLNNIKEDVFLKKAMESGFLIEKYGLPYSEDGKVVKKKEIKNAPAVVLEEDEPEIDVPVKGEEKLTEPISFNKPEPTKTIAQKRRELISKKRDLYGE